MAQTKKRKKKFFNVEIPLINKQTHLQAYELQELEGRFVKYDLTRMLRGKSRIIQLKVKIKGDEAITIPKKINLMPFFLKRMVRKGTDYVEDSFSAKCKDAEIKIKPFLVTRRKVSRAVRKALREKAKEELINYVKDKNSEVLFDEIINNSIQKSLGLKLKKIYPLSLCEIRVLEVKKDMGTKPEKEEKVKPEK